MRWVDRSQEGRQRPNEPLQAQRGCRLLRLVFDAVRCSLASDVLLSACRLGMEQPRIDIAHRSVRNTVHLFRRGVRTRPYRKLIITKWIANGGAKRSLGNKDKRTSI
jgi:hypothetical protein